MRKTMTDYIPIMINGIFVGIGVAIGTTIAELWIRPHLQKIREKTKINKIEKEKTWETDKKDNEANLKL